MIRPATLEDIRQFYGYEIPITARALAMERDGKVVGVGGYYLNNGAVVVFTDNDGSLSKREVIEGGRAVLDQVKKFRGRVVAEAGEDGTTALRHFGFVESGNAWVLP